MERSSEQDFRGQNKAIVPEAFDTLFNQPDYATTEKFWSPDYIQHSAHISPGRDGLFSLIKTSPDLDEEIEALLTAVADRRVSK